jgi:hypothetical protein
LPIFLQRTPGCRTTFEPDMRLLLIILAITAAVYAPVVNLGFVSDDNGLILNPATGIAQQTIGSVFQSDLWHFQESQSGYYRPLMMLSLMLDHTLFGDWAGGYHLHSLLWHLAATFLLGRLLTRLFDPMRGAIAAAVYALHPVVSEIVCFVSARNDSMALALGIGAVHLAAPRSASRNRLLAATALAAAAGLSKENGLVVLGLLPLIDWARGSGSRGWNRHAALTTGAMIALFLREVAGPGLNHSPPMNAAAMMADTKLTVLGTMMAKLTWPTPLTDSLHLAYLGPANLPAAAAMVFLIGFIAVVGGRWAQCGLVFFFVALVPGLMAVASRYLIGERYLAMPLVGLLISLVAICPRSPKLIWFLVLMAPWAWTSHQRIADWTSDLTLARSAHEALPSAYTAAWYGHELARDGQTEAAIPLLDHATASTPPTCDFAAEWIRAELAVRGPDAAIGVAQSIWERRCAAAPGVRGMWAQTLLEAGDLDGAATILSPRPEQCDASLAIAMVTVDLIHEQTAAAKRCAAESGLPLAELQPAVNRLVKTFQATSPQAAPEP